MIEASQSIIVEQNNPAINRHFELGIKTLLQNVPRHADDKLERLLKVKEKGHYVLGPEDGFQEG